MTVQHFIRRILVLAFVLCLPVSVLLAASESYIQTLTGKIKQGDACEVIDDKFLHLSLDDWNKLQHLSVDNIISFELEPESPVYFYNKSFTCTLNVSVKYFTSRDQTVPDEINNIDLVVKYDAAKGGFYPASAHYKFKNAFKVSVVVNSITSQELGNDIPAIFRIKNQILVERKYPFDAHAKGALTVVLQSDQPATGSPLLKAFSASANATTVSNGNQIFISWNPVDYKNPEEYDIEWTYIDALSENGELIASAYGKGAALPTTGKVEEWMKNDNTRVTISASSYTINLPYPDGYVLVRIRGVSYQVNTNLRLLGDWNYDNGNGFAVCVPVTAHESGLNWQYTGSFAEEGKRKEIITYYDASLRNRQAVTVNNSDKTLVPNSTTERQATAVVQETIYDQMGRAAVNILPAPTNSKSLNYYPGFNVDNNNIPFSHKNIRLNTTCTAIADPLNTSSGASKYYSPNNPFKSDPEYYFTKYVPDARQYPYTLTEYAPDNTGQIRRQSGVGETLSILNGHETQYFSAKPKQKELDRLFGVEAGDASHYLKNMVIDPNGQASVSYIDAKGKTVATALAGSKPPKELDALPSRTASEATIAFDEQLISTANFRRDGAEMAMNATATFMAAEPGIFDLHYSVNPSALTTTHSQGQFCSNCYYEVLVEVRNDCGKSYGSTTSTAFTLNDIACNPNAAPVTGTMNVNVDEPGTYNVSYTLRLSQQVVNYQTEYYLQHNSDLKTLQLFFEEKLKEMDLAGCYSSCESCKTLGTTPDAFRQKVWDLLGTDKFSGVTATNEVNLWINDTWNDLKAKCNNLSCNVTSACEDYLIQMKADVRPGGQYALITYDENQGTYSYNDRNISVLRFYNVNAADNSEIWNFSFTKDDGNSEYIRNLSESDFIKAYMDHPEWADMFVKKHIEYCGYLFCKDQSYPAGTNNEASYNFDKTLREQITTGEDAERLGYYVYDNPFALVNLDPFFNGGRGSDYKTNMNGDLFRFSDVIGFFVKDANGTFMPSKRITYFIDWMLYCKPSSSDPTAWLNSWNSPVFNGACRSKTMEWEMYRNYYLQLKSKYVQKVKEAMAPNCVNCFVGQDAIAKTDDCLPPDQSQYSILETDLRSGPTYAIVYQNGNAPFPV